MRHEISVQLLALKSSSAVTVFCASGAAAETADMSGLSAGSVNAPAKPTFPPSLAVRCESGPAMDNFVGNKIEQPQADPQGERQDA